MDRYEITALDRPGTPSRFKLTIGPSALHFDRRVKDHKSKRFPVKRAFIPDEYVAMVKANGLVDAVKIAPPAPASAPASTPPPAPPAPASAPAAPKAKKKSTGESKEGDKK